MRKTLKPIEPKNAWSAALQKCLEAAIKEVIYDPLITDYDETVSENAKTSPLIEAIKKGTVNYRGDKFQAKKWNATLSRELKSIGAKYLAKGNAYVLPLPQMPTDLAVAVTASQAVDKTILEKFLQKISDMPNAMLEKIKVLDLGKYSSKVSNKTSAAFKKTVLDVMAVQPDLTQEQRIYVDEDYVTTVTKPILTTLDKKFRENIDESLLYFAEEEVVKLRQMVEGHVFAGKPRSELIKKIEGRLHIGYTRAKFIARQETSLYTAKLKESQYRASGIKTYKWMTVGDGAVRHEHKILNRRVFDWTNPPIVDEATGRRGHPGEDFNCRCTASPIAEF